jgi:hypothetical protein
MSVLRRLIRVVAQKVIHECETLGEFDAKGKGGTWSQYVASAGRGRDGRWNVSDSECVRLHFDLIHSSRLDFAPFPERSG